MELIKTPYKIKCEMGVCKNKADYSIHLSRCGIKSRIHICKDCAKELNGLLSKELKSKKRKKSGGEESEGAEDNAQ